MNRKRFAGVVLVLLAIGVVMQIPDIKRYLAMRAM